MRHTLIFICLLFIGCAGTNKFIATTHSNGEPEVVVFMQGKGEDAEKVMEKVFYENGQLEYVGRFENGVEHGEWTYYYEDGTTKYEEQWENGLEHGIHYDYAPDGQVHRELHFQRGKLVKEVDRTRQ